VTADRERQPERPAFGSATQARFPVCGEVLAVELDDETGDAR
jgi:hypothetical protein